MDSARHRNRFRRRAFSIAASTKARLMFITSLFCLMVLTFAFSRSQTGGATSATSVAVNESTAARVLTQGFVQGKTPTQVSEVESITITPYGFEPPAITRPQGLFIIAYENRSDSIGVSPHVDTGSGATLHQLSMSPSKRSWIGAFDLPPGVYFIKEPSRPDWICVLTIK